MAKENQSQKKMLEVGQTVWLERFAMRHGGNSDLIETTITKVGHKWFEVDAHNKASFSIVDGTQKPADYRHYRVWFDANVYYSEQRERNDRAELDRLWRNTNNPPIEKVRKLIAVLKEQ